MDKLVLSKIKQKVNNLPSLPGVYKMLDKDNNIIYIGKAKNLKNRVSSYFINTSKQPKVFRMLDNVYDFDYIVASSEFEALNLESNLIHANMPFYNILLKDGKAFPYIKINLKQKFPKVEVTRRLSKDGAMYFGPYFGKCNVNVLMQIIRNTFKLKDCNLTHAPRPCLNYTMGLCLAPCVNKVTQSEYLQEVNKVIDFLNGDYALTKKILLKKMQDCVNQENFEQAIILRNQLLTIDGLSSTNVANLDKLLDVDIFGFASKDNVLSASVSIVRGGKMIGVQNYLENDYLNSDGYDNECDFVTQYYIKNKLIPSNIILKNCDSELQSWLTQQRGKNVNVICPKSGTKAQLLKFAYNNANEELLKGLTLKERKLDKTINALKQLQSDLNLTKLPKRIEGYDISNISGTNTVSSMVVFIDGEKRTKLYRKFKIDIDKPNDFLCMRQTLMRRLSELSGTDVSFSSVPDLILIDGGMGQLNYAYSVLQELDKHIDIVSLAKRNEEVYKPNCTTPIVLSKRNNGLQILQNVRDESHRFAITFHRSLRNKKSLNSVLTQIDGVGEATSKVLLTHFKSIENIASQTPETLNSVPKINKTIANNIYNYFINHPYSAQK